MLGRYRVEIGFAREIAAQATVGVFDAAFLPWGVRIAEVGLQTEPVQTQVSGELGAVIEGDCLAQTAGNEREPILKMTGNEVCSFILGAVGEEDTGGSLVDGENVLSGVRGRRTKSAGVNGERVLQSAPACERVTGRYYCAPIGQTFSIRARV